MKPKLHTDGSGLWSKHKAAIECEDYELRKHDSSYGEFRVFFDSKSWDVKKHGLIYTDKLFLKELRAIFDSSGMSEKACADIDYSEQGMQGADYVSFDVGKDFISSWRQIHGVG